MGASFVKSRYEATVGDFYSSKALLNYYSSFQVVYPLTKLSEQDFFGLLPELLTSYFNPESLENFVSNKIASANLK